MFQVYYLPPGGSPPLLGDGYPIVLTGWKPRSQFANIPKENYATLGEVYSASGAGYVIRNLLANPDYRDIVMCRMSKWDKSPNSGTTKILEWWDSSFEAASTDGALEGIEMVALRQWRSQATLHLVYGRAELEELLFKLKKQSPLLPPKFFPPPPVPDILSYGSPWGHHIVGDTIEKSWEELAHRVVQCGRNTDEFLRELLGASVVVRSPASSPEYSHYYEQILTALTKGDSYSYGDRLRSYPTPESVSFDQISWAIEKLSVSPESKRVVLSLWLPGVDTQEESFPPCLNHIWLRQEKGSVHAIATFRSHDVGKAWLQNVHGLARLLEVVSEHLGLAVGRLQINSHSAHIYSEDLRSLPKYRYSFQADDAGNYVVGAGGKGAIVTLLDFQGAPLKVYEGENKQRLLNQILTDNPSISPRHAAYLAFELSEYLSGK